ncbi:DUF3307 domain-containing protein [Algoriphagus aestuariicola]|jgi:hypothetical protein|uniref:DUF3307 domain-containing protein n=1 Tax=Algoriphagus aestuariicola TaxID=1852016 RepID=A0ABS3BRM1_9BACT|nr:DUF3307 domain-containing protein [Algoriphagus aestuariicola]MBN7800916.1 DUF3307 domain-containing protein [Algoriphagus aestuariicola]
MIILLKLLCAHFLGDFVLQPKSWVADKEQRKAKSSKLYLHLLLHGLLAWLVLWNLGYWFLALAVALIHGVIDLAKLYAQKPDSKARWFLIDQGMHLASLLLLWQIWFGPALMGYLAWLENPEIWLYATALIFLTAVSGIVVQVMLSTWSRALEDGSGESLSNAGRYIGILERLFVFTFVVTGNWAAIGFLLAAKSVFRFGDLKESKDRKLTEYILIGTLLSFGIALGTGMLVLRISSYF